MRVDFANPMVWAITLVAAASPFVLGLFVPVHDNAFLAVIFPLVVIPLVWLLLWRLYARRTG